MKAVYFNIALLYLVSVTQNVFGKEFIPGGINQHDTSDPKIETHIKKLIQDQNSKSNAESQDFVRVTEVKKQVVAGVKYYVKFQTLSSQNKTPYSCSAVYVVQEWVSDELKELEYHCDSDTKKGN